MIEGVELISFGPPLVIAQIISNTFRHPVIHKIENTLKDEDYKKFYHTLYPMQDDPLFWIHLNVDFPFNLTPIIDRKFFFRLMKIYA